MVVDEMAISGIPLFEFEFEFTLLGHYYSKLGTNGFKFSMSYYAKKGFYPHAENCRKSFNYEKFKKGQQD